MVLFDGDVNPLDIALKIDMIPTKNGGLSLNVYIYISLKLFSLQSIKKTINQKPTQNPSFRYWWCFQQWTNKLKLFTWANLRREWRGHKDRWK